MSLKVYKGNEASRDYENDFFREFSSNLVKMFEVEGLDGVLIGHPEVPDNKYLKPDCVLITQNRLVIIDFKNYNDEIEVYLPDEYRFSDAKWTTNRPGLYIGGGSTVNPFAELSRQRRWVEELIGTPYVEVGGIATVVCFQHNVTVLNEVPGKFQSWFSVTNSLQYLNRIRDVIGVHNPRPVNVDKLQSYFRANEYNNFFPVDLKTVEEVSQANERSAEARRREILAESKVRELEYKIAEAETMKESAAKLKTELSAAKAKVLKAKQEAEKAKNDFDEKYYDLEMENKKAIRATADAAKATADVRIAEVEMKKVKTKSRLRALTALVIACAIVACGGIGLGIYQDMQNRQAEAERIAVMELENSYRNGRTCIPVERASDFLGATNVCVDFYCHYINDSPYSVFVDDEKNGTFALMIPKKLISEAEAKEKYLNRHIEARGTIEFYEPNNTYEIKITNLSQITVKE